VTVEWTPSPVKEDEPTERPAARARKLEEPESGLALMEPRLLGPPKYRTGTLEAHAASTPEAILQRLQTDPEAGLEELVGDLTADVEDPFLQAKLIHDWIAAQIAYDTEAYFGDKPSATKPPDVVRAGKAVCAGYARLFEHMATLAGLEATTISGHARGAGVDSFATEEIDLNGHAWNAVKLDGHWFLLDTTWDAGHVTEAETFERSYSTYYLFLDPEKFVRTHWPAEERWQLLDPPMTADTFLEMPYLRGAFFAHGLDIASTVERVAAATDRASLEIRTPPDQRITTRVVDTDGNRLDNRSMVQHTGSSSEVHATFPGEGLHILQVFVRAHGDSSGTLAAEFGFEAGAGTTARFPTFYGAYTDLGCTLESPRHSPLPPGETTIRISVPGVHAVLLYVGDDRRWFKRIAGDQFEITTVLPTTDEPVTLYAQLQPGDSKSQALVRY